MALDPDVAEAVGGEPRLEDVAVDAGRDDAVDLAGASGSGRNGIAGRRCSIVTSPSGPSASPWVSVISVPSGPRLVSRTRPLMFWPRSTTCTPGRSSVTEIGRISSTGRTGGAGEVTSASYPRVADGDRLPVAARPRRPGSQPTVLALALDQVGGEDVRGDQRQVASVPTTVVAAVLVLEVQLGEERRLARPTGRRRAGCRPGRGTSRRRAARRARAARAEEVVSVVRLDLGAVPYSVKPGVQLVGADADAVELELVDAVRGGVQARPGRPVAGTSTSPRGGTPAGCRRARGRGRERPTRPASRRRRAARPRRPRGPTTRSSPGRSRPAPAHRAAGRRSAAGRATGQARSRRPRSARWCRRRDAPRSRPAEYSRRGDATRAAAAAPRCRSRRGARPEDRRAGRRLTAGQGVHRPVNRGRRRRDGTSERRWEPSSRVIPGSSAISSQMGSATSIAHRSPGPARSAPAPLPHTHTASSRRR